MKYIIVQDEEVEVDGEYLSDRTASLLKDCGVNDADIAIVMAKKPVTQTDDTATLFMFDIEHFPNLTDPACYLLGDIYYSSETIKIIVDTETKDIDLFVNLGQEIALKVKNQKLLRQSMSLTKIYEQQGLFVRQPYVWHLLQVAKKSPLNIINFNDFVTLTDYKTKKIEVAENEEHSLYIGSNNT